MKIKGFLLLEACMGLFIACLGVALLSITVGQGKKVQEKMEIKVDQKLANQIKELTASKSIKIHDRNY